MNEKNKFSDVDLYNLYFSELLEGRKLYLRDNEVLLWKNS